MRRVTLVAATALSVALGPVGVAVAEAAPTPKPSTTAPGEAKPRKPGDQRVKRFCARAERVSKRIDRVLGRIQAGADKPGSVAWLRAQSAAVKGEHKELATVLENQAKRREARVGVLTTRRTMMKQATTWCAGR